MPSGPYQSDVLLFNLILSPSTLNSHSCVSFSEAGNKAKGDREKWSAFYSSFTEKRTPEAKRRRTVRSKAVFSKDSFERHIKKLNSSSIIKTFGSNVSTSFTGCECHAPLLFPLPSVISLPLPLKAFINRARNRTGHPPSLRAPLKLRQ